MDGELTMRVQCYQVFTNESLGYDGAINRTRTAYFRRVDDDGKPIDKGYGTAAMTHVDNDGRYSVGDIVEFKATCEQAA